ncbi:MAG: Wzz/FepE/Etk N-terminal domain-containing protein, partial [Longimicrobiales bacterium]
MLRRRWLLVASVLSAFVLAAAVLTWFQEPVWVASTLVRIEAGNTDPFAGYDGLPGSQSDLETEMRVVRTSPIAARVVDSMGLTLSVSSSWDGDPRSLLRDVVVDPGGSVPATFKVTRVDPESYDFEILGGDSRRIAADEIIEVPGASFRVIDEPAYRALEAGAPTELLISTNTREGATDVLLSSLSVVRPSPTASLFEISYRGPERHL